MGRCDYAKSNWNGYETVKAAVENLDGKQVSKTIDTGFYWYDKKNIDDPKIKEVLYQ